MSDDSAFSFEGMEFSLSIGKTRVDVYETSTSEYITTLSQAEVIELAKRLVTLAEQMQPEVIN